MRAIQLNKNKEFSFVSRLLQLVDSGGSRDEKMFKVIIGVIGVIKEVLGEFNQIMFDWRCLTPENRSVYKVTIDQPGEYGRIVEKIIILFRNRLDYEEGLEMYEVAVAAQLEAFAKEILPKETYPTLDLQQEFVDALFEDGREVVDKIYFFKKKAKELLLYSEEEIAQHISRVLSMNGRVERPSKVEIQNKGNKTCSVCKVRDYLSSPEFLTIIVLHINFHISRSLMTRGRHLLGTAS